MPPQSNDHLHLIPQTAFAGPALTFDLPGVLIGVAEYAEGLTGCTVFRFPGGAATAIDVRGGMVGMTQAYEFCSAICLAGGSLLGLEAATGVTSGIFAQQGYSFKRGMPLVNGAIIFDYGTRSNTVYPDKALGRAALAAAQAGVYPLGARGAGRSAGVGGVFDFAHGESSGQGGAYCALGGIKLAVFTVVNALGVVVDRSGRVVRGNLDPLTGERADPAAEAIRRISAGTPTQHPTGNTTLTVLITDVKLDGAALTQLGRQVHSSMARAIRPFHTLHDGDVFYSVTTGAGRSKIPVSTLGLVAAELAWDAVLVAVGGAGEA